VIESGVADILCIVSLDEQARFEWTGLDLS
jgi:hypothetical protein